MTRKDAVEHLKEWKECISSGYRKAVIDMAIEALSKPIVDITQRDLCAEISCTDCPFMQETCKLMDYVAYADRPHGEWICKGDYAECSECGGSSGTQFDGVEPIPRITAFCPHCGVDMRKEKP